MNHASRRDQDRDRAAARAASPRGAVRLPLDPQPHPASVRRRIARAHHRHRHRRDLRRGAERCRRRRERKPRPRARRPLPRRLDDAPLRPAGTGCARDPDGARDARLSRRTRRGADRGQLAAALEPRTRRPAARRPRPHPRRRHGLCERRRMTRPENPRMDNQRHIAAPTGTELSAKSWLTEAPLRMLMNNLDARVAENPQVLVVYGGIGRAARDWQSFDRIVEVLRRLEDDQTLLVQSGKPVGVFRTHRDAPRVLIANSNLVPKWATWEHFHALDRAGLMMYGQMTAGRWIYIGTQGIVQGPSEPIVEMGSQH